MRTFGTELPEQPLPESHDHADARTVYRIAVDPEYPLPHDSVVEALREVLRPPADGPNAADLDATELTRPAREWARAETRRFRELFERHESDREAGGILRRHVVLECAPLGLVAGAWLQWLNCSGTCEDDLALRTLALYAADVGAGSPRRSRGEAYLALLRAHRLAEYAEPVDRVAADPRIPDHAFTVAAVLLLMSRAPNEFAAEIMGADLCLRAIATLPALAAVRAAAPTATDWDRIDMDTAVDGAAIRPFGRSAAIVESMSSDPEHVAGIERGFRWVLGELTSWSAALYEESSRACDPAAAMADLVRRRAREARVYHHDFRLAGRPLSEWFTLARTDPEPMVRALATSGLVRPGRPDASALVTTLVAEKGRMFRVFTDEDLAVIRRWITALADDRGVATAESRRAVVTPWSTPGVFALPEAGAAPTDIRTAYHLLHTRRYSSALHDYAVDYVRAWLERAREHTVHLPAAWDAAGLRPWLLDQHDRHALEYEQSDEPLPTREQLIEESVQLAPMILIDGAWLQGFTDYSLASTDIGYSLFATYWDELGNSELRLNHPLIYRQLLEEMGVRLPPTASREFAEWEGFEDRSFAVPVYWLALSRRPRTYMPELLGLNLAIELSGVGGTYRRMRRAHAAHALDTRFIDIHSTIDNVSTGHSAWASDAIDIYLASLTRTEGAEAASMAWQRIRTGYAALNPADIGL